MNITKSEHIEGVWTVDLTQHRDDRGYFSEVFRREWFDECEYLSIGNDKYIKAVHIGVEWHTVQLNHSYSRTGVLRGLHYHKKQVDYWYVASGKIQVGLVDLNVDPREKNRVETLILEPGKGLFIPEMVAHGFLALEPTNLLYLVNQYYNPDDEHGIAWDKWGIDWDLSVCPHGPIISERDSNYEK